MTLSTPAVAVLLSERFAQLAEKPRVLNRDHGLRGEVAEQIDLLIREWLDFLPIDYNGADELVVLQHRDAEHSPKSALLNARDNKWMPPK